MTKSALMPFLLTMALIAALAKGALAGDIAVIAAHAPASLTPTAKSGAVYLTFKNTGPEPDVFTGISTASAASAMIHSTVNENDVMKMRMLDRLDIAPGETVTFATGGLHIMLMGLKAPLKDGDRLEVILKFAKAGDIKVDVPVSTLGPAASTEKAEEQ